MIIDTPWMPNVLGGGDVAGPASATDNAVARFDGTTGKLIQNSVVTIADSTGAIAGAQSLTSPAATNLTLATVSFGAAITVASASGNVGIGTTTPTTGFRLDVVGEDFRVSDVASGDGVELGWSAGGSTGFVQVYDRINSAFRNLALNNSLIVTATGNVLIGTPTDITGTSGLKVAGTTASSTTGSGALQVAGGAGIVGNINVGGTGTFVGTIIAPAATASLAPLRIPHGTAPTSPTNGDMWTTTAGLYIRINNATVGPLS